MGAGPALIGQLRSRRGLSLVSEHSPRIPSHPAGSEALTQDHRQEATSSMFTGPTLRLIKGVQGCHNNSLVCVGSYLFGGGILVLA